MNRYIHHRHADGKLDEVSDLQNILGALQKISALKLNSRQNATQALFVNIYESNLRVKAYLRQKRHF